MKVLGVANHICRFAFPESKEVTNVDEIHSENINGS